MTGLSLVVTRKAFRGSPRGSQVAVLADISLEITRGEVVCIFGPSGCGKSTLLRIVAGVDADFVGSLKYVGVKLSTDVGWLPQEDSLLPWKRVRENVHLARDLAGLPRSELLVDHALGLVSLKERERDWPYMLSGGMRRRVALARTLALEARLLVLDEPFSGLDFVWRDTLTRTLRERVSAKGLMAVVATHSLGDATALATKLVVLGGNPARLKGVAVIEEGVCLEGGERVRRKEAAQWVRERFASGEAEAW